jgi:hypothetical protein
MTHWFLALVSGHLTVAVIAAFVIGRFFAVSEIDTETAAENQSSAV